jgi:hypothetical protein
MERNPKRNLVSVADAAPDTGPLHFGKPDPDLFQSEKQDPNLCQIKRRIRIRITVKLQELQRLKMEHGRPWKLTKEAWQVCKV